MLPVSSHSIFDSSIRERMSPADFKFARRQLQQIFSREMSKASINLEKKEKVQLNLETQNQVKEQLLKQEEATLLEKLQKAELKRKLFNDRQSKIREVKELKWVQRKARAESVQEKTIMESEKRQKELNRDLEEYRKRKNNKSIVTPNNHSPHSPQHNDTYSDFIYQNIERGMCSQRKSKEKLPGISNSLRKEQREKGLKLNKQILQHQKKKIEIHKEKEVEILQNYIQRIQSIERRREQRSKGKSEHKKLQPSSYRVAKSKEREFRDRNRMNVSEREEPKQRDRIEDRLKNKSIMDEYEFNERTSLLESIERQGLKISIIKQIKKKVNEHKILSQR